MGENSGIQWTRHTFNPWIGCTRVSAECDHCYADSGSRRLAAQHGLKLWDDGSSRYFTSESYWAKPLAWNRAAAKAGERHRVFCASYSDVFEDRDELIPKRVRLFELIERTPMLDWLLLTKRPENIARMVTGHYRVDGMPRNVWLGTTVGVRPSLLRAVQLVTHVPRATVKFLSIEPQTEGLDPDLLMCAECRAWWPRAERTRCTSGRCDGDNVVSVLGDDGISWVIQGGESGPKARSFDVAWARRLHQQCVDRRVAYFLKQLGARPWDSDIEVAIEVRQAPALGPGAVGVCTRGNTIPLRDSHGGDVTEWPADVPHVREFPQVAA